MDLISGLFLHSGQALNLTPSVSVCHPTVGSIMELNHGFLCEDYYWTYVFTLLADPYDHMVYLDDNGIDYERVSAFDVFLMRWKDARKDYLANREKYLELGVSPFAIFEESLAFFFGRRRFYLGKLGDEAVIADEDDPTWLLNRECFQIAIQFIKQCNCIVRTDQIKPATKSAKRILIEDRRLEEKRQKNKFNKKEDKVERLAEAIAVVDAGVGMPVSYQDLPVYRLLSAGRNIQRRVVVQSILNGIHTGMLKADGISDKELRWAQA